MVYGPEVDQCDRTARQENVEMVFGETGSGEGRQHTAKHDGRCSARTRRAGVHTVQCSKSPVIVSRIHTQALAHKQRRAHTLTNIHTQPYVNQITTNKGVVHPQFFFCLRNANNTKNTIELRCPRHVINRKKVIWGVNYSFNSWSYFPGF